MSVTIPVDRQPNRRIWNAGPQIPVWPSVIVINCPLPGQHPHVSLIHRNEPVQALPPQTANQPFAIRVCLRCLDWSLEYSDSKGCHVTVQVRRENARSIVDQPAISMVAGNRFSELLRGPRGR